MMKLVVPIMPRSLKDLSQLDRVALSEADLIEWRADVLSKEDSLALASAVVEQFGRERLLITVRTAQEGGQANLDDEDYLDLLIQLNAYQPAYLDVEYFSHKAAFEQLRDCPNLILSYHNFERTPAHLTAILDEMTAQKPAVVKLAVMPQDEADVLRLMMATRELANRYPEQTYVTMAMGELGKLSRLAGNLTGSAWSFASLEAASAPGQLPLAIMKQILEVLDDD